MRINESIKEKIRKEEEKYKFNKEFGGYVIVENDEVKDIIFDVENSSFFSVDFGAENIMKLPEEERNKTRGWFHKHGVNDFSQQDVMTTMQLTQFWGECYTIILQRNGYLLLVKTIAGRDFIFRKPIVVETFRQEIEYHNGGSRYGLVGLSKSIRNIQRRRI